VTSGRELGWCAEATTAAAICRASAECQRQWPVRRTLSNSRDGGPNARRAPPLASGYFVGKSTTAEPQDDIDGEARAVDYFPVVNFGVNYRMRCELP
jgi:hypothetical protein